MLDVEEDIEQEGHNKFRLCMKDEAKSKNYWKFELYHYEYFKLRFYAWRGEMILTMYEPSLSLDKFNPDDYTNIVCWSPTEQRKLTSEEICQMIRIDISDIFESGKRFLKAKPFHRYNDKNTCKNENCDEITCKTK